MLFYTVMAKLCSFIPTSIAPALLHETSFVCLQHQGCGEIYPLVQQPCNLNFHVKFCIASVEEHLINLQIIHEQQGGRNLSIRYGRQYCNMMSSIRYFSHPFLHRVMLHTYLSRLGS